MSIDINYSNLKNLYLNYMIYYQAVEEYFSHYVIENLGYKNYKTIKSFNRLSCLFLDIARKNKKYSESKLNTIKDLIVSIKRDYMIHEFTNDILDADKKSDWVYKLVINEARVKKLSSIIKELLNMVTNSDAANIFKHNARHFERSNISISFTSDKLNPESYTNVAQLKTILADNYFHLISLYNIINKNLFVIIKDINRKYHIWSDIEINVFKNQAIGVMYETLISNEGPKGILIKDVINNLGPIKDSIRDVYRDRNYWVHFFAVDFYKKHHHLVKNCGKCEELLECIDSIRTSIVFSENFNNALVGLKI